MVAISNAYGFVFLKTRKTAGTTIERVLVPFCTEPHSDVTLEGSEKHYAYDKDRGSAPEGWRPHIPAKRARNRLGHEKWKRYFRFTAVRNPFDRAISHFFWLRRHEASLENQSFHEVRDMFKRFCIRSNYATDRDIVTIGDDLVVEDAIRFERLNDDIYRIGKRLELALPEGSLPEINVGIREWNGKAISEFFDQESIDAVRRSMEWVFEHFGYSEDPRDQTIPPPFPEIETQAAALK